MRKRAGKKRHSIASYLFVRALELIFVSSALLGGASQASAFYLKKPLAAYRQLESQHLSYEVVGDHNIDELVAVLFEGSAAAGISPEQKAYLKHFFAATPANADEWAALIKEYRTMRLKAAAVVNSEKPEDKDKPELVYLIKLEGQAIGLMSLEAFERVVGGADAAIYIKREFSRQGYALEAGKNLLKIASELLAIDALFCEVDLDNIPSWKLVQSLGATLVDGYESLQGVDRLLFVYGFDGKKKEAMGQ